MNSAYYSNNDQHPIVNTSNITSFTSSESSISPNYGPSQSTKQQFNCESTSQSYALELCQRSKIVVPTDQKMAKYRFQSPLYYDQPDQQQYNQLSSPMSYQNTTCNNNSKHL